MSTALLTSSGSRFTSTTPSFDVRVRSSAAPGWRAFSNVFRARRLSRKCGPTRRSILPMLSRGVGRSWLQRVSRRWSTATSSAQTCFTAGRQRGPVGRWRAPSTACLNFTVLSPAGAALLPRRALVRRTSLWANRGPTTRFAELWARCFTSRRSDDLMRLSQQPSSRGKSRRARKPV